MSNAIFPKLKGLTYPVDKVYDWKTLRVYEHPTGGCKSFLSQKYPSSITFKLKYAYLDGSGLDDDSLKTLVGFFNARKSGYDDFLFEDPSLNYIEDQQIGIFDGSTYDFQLVANYGEGLIPIYGSVMGTPRIFVNGTEIGWYSISDYGVVSINSAFVGLNVGDIITATTFFYHRVKFYGNSITDSEIMNKFSITEVALKTFKPSGV